MLVHEIQRFGADVKSVGHRRYFGRDRLARQSIGFRCRIALRISPSVNTPHRTRSGVQNTKAPVPALSRLRHRVRDRGAREKSPHSRGAAPPSHQSTLLARSRRRIKSTSTPCCIHHRELADLMLVHQPQRLSRRNRRQAVMGVWSQSRARASSVCDRRMARRISPSLRKTDQSCGPQCTGPELRSPLYPDARVRR